MPDPLPTEAVPSQVDAAGHAPTIDETSAFTPTHGGVPVAPTTVDDPLIGATIGRYTLLKKLGEGGMGSVYLAEQSEPVKRQIALKLIRGNVDSRTILARFEAERQALAVMDHPNIARIYDGGIDSPLCPGGRGVGGEGETPRVIHHAAPYFVMELVQGVPITEYCDQHRLSPRQRLDLFVPICQAVQHAHQKGIIHRDLKPSNVLVTEVDGKPVPKVIDFGVAKATEQPLTDQSIGDTGAIVGTPTYMSPEQADPESMDIDTRTDIYALGVMLYELLTGSTPIDAKQFRRGAILEVLRMVREVEPPRPSTKLSTAEALPSIAANRNIEPRQLQAMLRGDVDWIVMKALEKDRTRRYDTANALSRDIQRYLADEVVEARPPSSGYRLKKFIRRNKGQVIAAGLVLATLVFGIIGTSVGYYRAEQSAEKERLAKEDEARQRQRAETNEKLASDRLVQVEAEKRRTEEEKRIAQAVRDFLQNKLLGQADPTMQANAFLERGQLSTEVKENPTIRELLDRAAVELEPERIEISFPKQPLLQAELLQTVGKAYSSIGGKDNDQYALAIRFLQRAIDLHQEHLGTDHSDTLKNQCDLAIAYHYAGQHDKSLPLLVEILRLTKAKLGPDHPDTLKSIGNLAWVYRETGQITKALPLLEDTYKLSKAKLGPDNVETLTNMNSLAYSYQAAGQGAKALPLFEETLKLRISKLGHDHPDTLKSMAGLAYGYQSAGDLAKALPLFEKTMKSMKVQLGADHPNTLSTINNLALAYREAGQPDKALPLFEETLRIQKPKLGADHPHTLTTMNNLALAYHDVGQLNKALPLFEEAYKLEKAKLGVDHPETLSTMSNLARGYQSAGKLDKALPLFEEALRLSKTKLGADHPDTLDSMACLASAYQDVGQLHKALPLLEEALKRTKVKLGPDHPNTLSRMNNLATCYQYAGQLDKALPLFEEALKLQKVKMGPTHPNTLSTMNNLALAYQNSRQLDKALPLFEETLKLHTAKLGADHPDSLNCMNNLAYCYKAARQLDKALPLFEETLKLRKAKLGPDHPDLLSTMAGLAAAFQDVGQLDKALPLYEETLRLCKVQLGPDHPHTLSSMGNLGGAYCKAKQGEKAAPLLKEFVTRRRQSQIPKDDASYAGLLEKVAIELLKVGQYPTTKEMLRECLTLREKVQPNEWTTFNTQSLLGETLLGQKKYADAEPLLLKGYEGMKQREKTIPPQAKTRIPETLDRLVQLYTETSKPDEVKKWQAEKAKLAKPVEKKN